MDSQNILKGRNAHRVALYVRVSSQEQADEGYSIGEQTERLKKYAEAMGWIVYKIYIDPGYSGGNMDRPGLNEMIRDVESGEVDTVVVYKLDRLSRSQYDVLYLVEKVFLANNTDFVSMTENFNTNSPLGRAMIGFLAVFAQLEKDKINERTLMGKEARAKEGKWHGGSTEPIGYNYSINDDMLYIDEYEAMQVREVFDLFIKGMAIRTIETMLEHKGYKHKYGPWNTKSIKRVLASKLYIGQIKHLDDYYKGIHEPLIDEETFNKAQILLQNRADAYVATGCKPGVQSTYLGGLTYCKKCGAKYTKQRGGSNKYGILYYYVCYSRGKVKKMIKDPNCKNKSYRMENLDNIIFDEIKKLSTDPEYIQTIKNEKNKNTDTPNKIDIIKKEILNIESQMSRFMDLYGLGNITIEQISEKIDPLNAQKKALERELENLNAESGSLSDEDTLELVTSFSEILERGDFNEIRLAIESLIYYVEIDEDDVYIHWKFA